MLLQCDVDVSSSSVAKNILRVVKSYAKKIVFDLAWGFEGKTVEHLPEYVIGWLGWIGMGLLCLSLCLACAALSVQRSVVRACVCLLSVCLRVTHSLTHCLAAPLLPCCVDVGVCPAQANYGNHTLRESTRGRLACH